MLSASCSAPFPQLHLVISTREDRLLSFPGLRAKGHLNELRAVDMRFTLAEAAASLDQTIGLDLSADDVAALDRRTEGWIAGLQLAAISLQGSDDPADFISSFSGSHRFVLDYLLEEVLQRQPEPVQDFLRRTSILDRMCGPLCDAVVVDSAMSGQEMLEYLEHANLFIGPLDHERRWYRYHHLFGELLRQRLHHSAAHSSVPASTQLSDLHHRASVWFEGENLELEAFHHAIAANDVEFAERLIRGKGVPLYVRGGAVPVLNWLESLPTPVLDATPRLWVMFATVLAVVGRFTRVEHNSRQPKQRFGANRHPRRRTFWSHGLLTSVARPPCSLRTPARSTPSFRSRVTRWSISRMSQRRAARLATGRSGLPTSSRAIVPRLGTPRSKPSPAAKQQGTPTWVSWR